jgi:hypothetical protein
MSAARLNSRALTVRGTLPQIGSFSLGAKRRGNPHCGAQRGRGLLRFARNDRNPLTRLRGLEGFSSARSLSINGLTEKVFTTEVSRT